MSQRRLYHVTPARNLDSITRHGLVPQVGERSMAAGESSKASYFFPSVEALEHGLTNWLGDQFPDEEQLALLTVDVTVGHARPTPNAAYEASVIHVVPPVAINIVCKDLDFVRDLRARLRDANKGPTP